MRWPTLLAVTVPFIINYTHHAPTRVNEFKLDVRTSTQLEIMCQIYTLSLCSSIISTVNIFGTINRNTYEIIRPLSELCRRVLAKCIKLAKEVATMGVGNNRVSIVSFPPASWISTRYSAF